MVTVAELDSVSDGLPAFQEAWRAGARAGGKEEQRDDPLTVGVPALMSPVAVSGTTLTRGEGETARTLDELSASSECDQRVERAACGVGRAIPLGDLHEPCALQSSRP